VACAVEYTDLSRATVYKIARNRHHDMKESVSRTLQRLLGVEHDELITWGPDMATYFKDDPCGFTQGRLEILNDEMQSMEMQLNYQVYSQNESMNVTTKYARNRLMYLDGNIRIFTYGLPELYLTSFDVISNRTNVSANEIMEFHRQLLTRVVNFAKKLGIYKIDYFVTNSVSDTSQRECICVTPEQNIQICEELGFQVGHGSSYNDFQTHFVKVFTEI